LKVFVEGLAPNIKNRFDGIWRLCAVMKVRIGLSTLGAARDWGSLGPAFEVSTARRVVPSGILRHVWPGQVA
jgi:hypothetical protein